MIMPMPSALSAPAWTAYAKSKVKKAFSIFLRQQMMIISYCSKMISLALWQHHRWDSCRSVVLSCGLGLLFKSRQDLISSPPSRHSHLFRLTLEISTALLSKTEDITIPCVHGGMLSHAVCGQAVEPTVCSTLSISAAEGWDMRKSNAKWEGQNLWVHRHSELGRKEGLFFQLLCIDDMRLKQWACVHLQKKNGWCSSLEF